MRLRVSMRLPRMGNPLVTALSPVRRSLRARKAQAVQTGSDTTDLDRDLAAEKLADLIARTVAAAPPFTPEQRDRLSALLTPATAPNPRSAATRPRRGRSATA